MKPKFLLVFMFLGILLVATGCETEEYDYEMVEGSLLNAKVENGDFRFAFKTEDGSVFDNYKTTKNFEIKIDDTLIEPELTYAKPIVIVKNLSGDEVDRRFRYEEDHVHSESFLDSGTKIVIKMNEETYHEIFDTSG